MAEENGAVKVRAALAQLDPEELQPTQRFIWAEWQGREGKQTLAFAELVVVSRDGDILTLRPPVAGLKFMEAQISATELSKRLTTGTIIAQTGIFHKWNNARRVSK